MATRIFKPGYASDIAGMFSGVGPHNDQFTVEDGRHQSVHPRRGGQDARGHDGERSSAEGSRGARQQQRPVSSHLLSTSFVDHIHQ